MCAARTGGEQPLTRNRRRIVGDAYGKDRHLDRFHDGDDDVGGTDVVAGS